MNRVTFFFLYAILIVISVLNAVKDPLLFHPYPYVISTFTVSVFVFWMVKLSGIILAIRRFHDIGHNGWFAFILSLGTALYLFVHPPFSYVILVLGYLFIGYLLFKPGMSRANIYGEKPKQTFLHVYAEKYHLARFFSWKNVAIFFQCLFIWIAITFIAFVLEGSFTLNGLDCRVHVQLCEKHVASVAQSLPRILFTALIITILLYRFVLKRFKIVNFLVTGISVLFFIVMTVLTVFAYKGIEAISKATQKNLQTLNKKTLITYTNPQYGYAVKYPSVFVVVPQDQTTTAFIKMPNSTPGAKVKNLEDLGFELGVTVLPTNSRTIEDATRKFDQYKKNPSFSSAPMVVASSSAFMFTDVASDFSTDGALLLHNKKEYFIFVKYFSKDSSAMNEASKMYKDFLNSFTFISTSSSGNQK